MSDDTFDHTRAYNAILRSLSEYYDHVVRLEAQVEELGAALARYEEPFTMTLEECEVIIGAPIRGITGLWEYAKCGASFHFVYHDVAGQLTAARLALQCMRSLEGEIERLANEA